MIPLPKTIGKITDNMKILLKLKDGNEKMVRIIIEEMKVKDKTGTITKVNNCIYFIKCNE